VTGVISASSSFLDQEIEEGKKINCPLLQILSSDLNHDISWLNFVNEFCLTDYRVRVLNHDTSHGSFSFLQ
jgi:hypothetical protein